MAISFHQGRGKGELGVNCRRQSGRETALRTATVNFRRLARPRLNYRLDCQGGASQVDGMAAAAASIDDSVDQPPPESDPRPLNGQGRPRTRPRAIGKAPNPNPPKTRGRGRVSRPNPLPPSSTQRVRKKSSAIPSKEKTSEILKQIVATNTGRTISVRQIVQGLGQSSFGTSLMVFSLPEVLPIPIPGISAVVVIPTGIISYQMIRGRPQIQLPEYLLKRTIPSSAFRSAVRAILPMLEKAEHLVKPRGRWVNHPWTKRFLGLFILVLAGVIALPIPGTNMPAAIAIFMIALGMVEKDGLLIGLGLLLGLASMALVGGIVAGLFALLGL